MEKWWPFLLLGPFLFGVDTGAGRRAQVIHWEGGQHRRRWVDHFSDHRGNLQLLLGHLERVPSGRAILAAARKKAKERGIELYQLVLPGGNSLTSTTLLRRFRPGHRVEYRVRSQIRLKRDLAASDAILDLAHELIHFIQRDAFNPYSGQFTPLQFLTHTIEGRGGEVAAYIAECRVGRELFPSLVREKCQRIRGRDGRFSRARAAQLFYRVGEHYRQISQLVNSLGADPKIMELLSPEHPVFISSAYDFPYPLAALVEYRSILHKACRNQRRYWSAFGKSPSMMAPWDRCRGPSLSSHRGE